TRSNDTTSVAYGRLIQTDIQDAYGHEYKKIVTAYANDPGGSPQVQSVTTYDDMNTPMMTDLAYDAYGNTTQQQEYGFQINGAWQVRRRATTSYVTTASYVNSYLRSLVSEIDVYDMSQGSGALMAKTTYAYDNYAVMGNMENYGGNYSGGSPPPGYN